MHSPDRPVRRGGSAQRRVVASALLVPALVVAGCRSEGSVERPRSLSANQSVAASAAADSLALGQTLAAAMQTQVYLQAASSRAVVRSSSRPDAAISAGLQRNSGVLVEAIRAGYGPEAARAFEHAWGLHMTLFQRLIAAHGSDRRDTFRTVRNRYRGSPRPLAAMFAGDGFKLPEEAMWEALATYVEAYFATLVFEKEPQAAQKLVQASTYARRVADLLAEGALRRAGDHATPEQKRIAHLKAGMVTLFQEHVYLVEVVSEHALARNVTEDIRESNEALLERSIGVLEANGSWLAQAIAAVYGSEAGEAFGSLWVRRVDMLVGHIQAARNQSPAPPFDLAASAALAEEQGTFLVTLQPGLARAEVVAALADSARALAEVADLTAKHDPAVWARVEAANASLRSLAVALVDGGTARARNLIQTGN